MRGILKPLQSSAEFGRLAAGLEKKINQQQVFGLTGSQLSYLLAGLVENTRQPFLVVTAGEREAVTLADELVDFLPGITVQQFPVMQLLPYQILHF